MKVAGIILAAGQSRRMGFPKALLKLGGETFVDRLIAALGRSCSPVIVVVGCEAERIRQAAARQSEAQWVVNAEWEQGQLSSLQCGLAAVPPEADGALFTLVDHPLVRIETVSAIVRKFESRSPEERLVIPRMEGRRGHPVCVARELFAEFLALPAGAQAREIIHRRLEHAAYVDTDDPGILEDADEPADYERMLGRMSP